MSMRTEELLQKYQEYLKKNTKPRRFNIYAFIFNSFYYVYSGNVWYFLLYFVANTLLTTLVSVTFSHLWLLALVVIIIRVINAMTADGANIRYMKHFITHNQDMNYTKPVTFFAVSRKRLIISSILSGGLYILYWMYKNWKAIKRDTQDNEVEPIFQSWLFGVFFMFSLMKVVRVNLERSKVANRRFTAMTRGIASLFMIQAFINQFLVWLDLSSFQKLILLTINIIVWIVLLATFASLQQRINLHNTKQNYKLPPQQLHHNWDIFVVIIGFMMLAGNILLLTSNKKDNQNTLLATASFYRQIEGYRDFCYKQGYEMKNYPQAFAQYYQPEIDIVREKLKTDANLTLEQAWILLADDKFKQLTQDSVREELGLLKPGIIRTLVQNLKTENGDAFSEIEATEYLEKEITLPLLCAQTDEYAEAIISNNETYKASIRELIKQLR